MRINLEMDLKPMRKSRMLYDRVLWTLSIPLELASWSIFYINRFIQVIDRPGLYSRLFTFAGLKRHGW